MSRHMGMCCCTQDPDVAHRGGLGCPWWRAQGLGRASWVPSLLSRERGGWRHDAALQREIAYLRRSGKTGYFELNSASISRVPAGHKHSVARVGVLGTWLLALASLGVLAAGPATPACPFGHRKCPQNLGRSWSCGHKGLGSRHVVQVMSSRPSHELCARWGEVSRGQVCLCASLCAPWACSWWVFLDVDGYGE